MDTNHAASTAVESPQENRDTPPAFGFSALDPVQARVLGVLVEKALSTADYYPLTLNATVNACNQKSNRSPVMELNEKAVSRALEHLREKHLVMMLHEAGARTVKFEHKLAEKIFVETRSELAILAELLLRGPQTPGQLRTRTERMHLFSDKEQVATILEKLARRGVPLVVCLGRQPGQKEARYMHLLCGTPDAEEYDGTAKEPMTIPVTEDATRMAALEEKVAALEEIAARLENEFAAFKKQFE